MSVIHIVVYGDSITEGTDASGAGGTGSWAELWSNRLANYSSGAHQIISPGFRGLWHSSALALVGDKFQSSTDEWQVDTIANWPQVAPNATYNKSPHGQMWSGQNGATAIATWLKQTAMAPVVGFDLLYVDGPLNGTTGNWQYQIDGGTWTNMGQSPAGDGALHKFYVNSAVTSTVKIRQFDGSASTVTYPVGIIPYYVDPRTTTNGMVLHNLGRFGFPLHSTAGQCASNPAGSAAFSDPLAFYDSCVLGTNAVAHTPILSTLEFVNDAAFNVSAATNATDLASFATRYRAKVQIPLVSFKMYEFGSGTGGATYATLAQYRTNQDNWQAVNPTWITLLDLFTAYQNLGFGGQGVQESRLLGALSDDGIHPNNAGNNDITQRLLYITLKNYIPSLYQPSWDFVVAPFVEGVTANGSAFQYAGGATPIYQLSDAVGITDLLGETATSSRSFTDAVAITDLFGETGARSRPFTDAVGITDALSRVLQLREGIADTVGITDTVTTHLVQSRSITDAVGISAMLGRILFRVSVADAVGITDTVVRTLQLRPAISDAVGVSDTLADHSVGTRVVSDAVGVTDVVGQLLFHGTVAETVGITDTVARSLQLREIIADAVGVSNTLRRALVEGRAFADLVGIAESFHAHLADSPALPDEIGTSSTVAVGLVHRQLFAEVVGIADAVAAFTSSGCMITDVVGISSLISDLVVLQGIHDVVGLTDILSIHAVTSATPPFMFTPTLVSVAASQNVAAVIPSVNSVTVV